MKLLKIAQIGAEHDHSVPIMQSLRKQSDIFQVAGYAIPEGESNVCPKAYEGLTRMTVEELLNIPDLDAVAIETSETNLTKYALAAARKGLAVHMDKPGGTELTDFETLIQTVKENGTVFHTGYMYRYNPAVIKLLQDIRGGKLGEIYSVEAHMNCMHKPEKRDWLRKYKGGMMFFLGCHLIDLIVQIQGRPEEILPLNCSTGMDGVTSEDFGMAVLKYKNGVSFAKTCAAEAGGFMRRQLVVCGSKGTVELKPLEAYADPSHGALLYTGVREVFGDQFDWGNDGCNTRTGTFDRYDAMMRSFAEYTAGEKKSPYSCDYELELYRTVLQCCGK